LLEGDTRDRTTEALLELSGLNGGAVENRTRLLFEIVEALTPAWGPDRIGVRISPMGNLNE
jgi:hypothetical protein